MQLDFRAPHPKTVTLLQLHSEIKRKTDFYSSSKDRSRATERNAKSVLVVSTVPCERSRAETARLRKVTDGEVFGERLLLIAATAAFAALLGLGDHWCSSNATVAIATADITCTVAGHAAGTASFAAIAATSFGADNHGSGR